MPRSSRSSDTPAQKGFRSAILVLFALIGLGLFVPIGASVVETVRTYFWKATPCVILESRRVEPGVEAGSTSDPLFVLRYRYVVDGRPYVSSRYSAGMQESLSGRKLEQLLWRNPVGDEATCYVDPKDPAKAIFRRGSLAVFAMLLFPFTFLAVSVGGLVATWRPDIFTGRFSTSASRKGLGTGAAILFFSVFALVGGGFLYFVTVRPLLLYTAARSWPEVPCEIVSSSVGTHHSTSGSGSSKTSSTTYSVDIDYRYKIGSREYRSDRYDIFGGSSSGYESKRAVVARYPEGSKAVCYVNPNDPTDALLQRGLTWFMLIGLLPLLFVLIGVGGLLGMIRSALKSRGSVTLPGVPSVPTTPTLPTGIGAGPAILTPSASPRAKFIGTIFFAAFWNGITGIFVGVAVKSWRTSSPEIFLSLFMIPFVLIGLALIGAVGAAFLNLFNPRVALAVNSQSLPPGGKLEVRWSFRGAAGRIRKLRIVLEGREEVTTGTGKNSRTERTTLATLPLVETEDVLSIREGSAQLEIPADARKSDDEGNTKVVWRLKVAGEIHRYPDVDEEFAFTVLPRGD